MGHRLGVDIMGSISARCGSIQEFTEEVSFEPRLKNQSFGKQFSSRWLACRNKRLEEPTCKDDHTGPGVSVIPISFDTGVGRSRHTRPQAPPSLPPSLPRS